MRHDSTRPMIQMIESKTNQKIEIMNTPTFQKCSVKYIRLKKSSISQFSFGNFHLETLTLDFSNTINPEVTILSQYFLFFKGYILSSILKNSLWIHEEIW